MSYKGIKTRMYKIYGDMCMLEASGIRYIPRHERMRIKGYKKNQEDLTYHHLKEKQNHGEETIENGAIIKRYNHEWLHKLSPNQREKVNNSIRKYKICVEQFGFKETQELIMSGKLNFKVPDLCDESVDYKVIKAYRNGRKQRKEDRQYASDFYPASR